MLKSFAIISALIFAAVPTHAATMKAVYTGTVTSGYDQDGLFGLPYSPLDGFDFTLTFVYDTSLGHRWSSPSYDRVAGGPEYVETTFPIISASFELNGITQSREVGNSNVVSVWSDSPSYGRYQHGLSDFPTGGDDRSLYSFFMYNFWNADLTPNLDIPVTLTSLMEGQEYTGGYFFASNDCEEDEYGGYLCHSLAADATLKPNKLVISSFGEGPAPVPLPATAGLLAGAVGILGAFAYSRRAAGSSRFAKS